MSTLWQQSPSLGGRLSLMCTTEGCDSSALADRLLEEAGVSLVPGHDFGANDPGRWMRLSYANTQERLDEAVRRMAGCLKPMR